MRYRVDLKEQYLEQNFVNRLLRIQIVTIVLFSACWSRLKANNSAFRHSTRRVQTPLSSLLLVLTICVGISAAKAERSGMKDTPLSIEHVTIYPMTAGGHALSDMTVRVKDGRISNILHTAVQGSSRGFKRINATGQWLMPALSDMHVHQENARLFGLFFGADAVPSSLLNNEDLLLPYVSNGVLQIFNPAAMSEEIGLRDDIEAGRILGPHIELAAMVDGDMPVWPVGFSHVATTPEDGRQFVRDMKAEGFRFIKTYSKLDLPTFSAIVAEAREAGLIVVGHIPGRRQDATEKWLLPGFQMVVHAEEFAYQSADVTHAASQIARYVALAKARDVQLTATLTTNERIVEQIVDHQSLDKRPELQYLNPATRLLWRSMNPYARVPPEELPDFEHVVDFNKKLVKAFADAGITVFPGTDSLVPGLVAGFSLHDELEALAGAGLSAIQILTADTRLAAGWLGVGADRGTVEVGKRADLLLLTADPMADVSNTRQIAAVIRDGQYLSRQMLDGMMTAMAHRYARMPAVRVPHSPTSPGTGGHLGDEN